MRIGALRHCKTLFHQPFQWQWWITNTSPSVLYREEAVNTINTEALLTAPQTATHLGDNRS
jgi:hypothetical protein